MCTTHPCTPTSRTEKAFHEHIASGVCWPEPQLQELGVGVGGYLSSDKTCLCAFLPHLTPMVWTHTLDSEPPCLLWRIGGLQRDPAGRRQPVKTPAASHLPLLRIGELGLAVRLPLIFRIVLNLHWVSLCSEPSQNQNSLDFL